MPPRRRRSRRSLQRRAFADGPGGAGCQQQQLGHTLSPLHWSSALRAATPVMSFCPFAQQSLHTCSSRSRTVPAVLSRPQSWRFASCSRSPLQQRRTEWLASSSGRSPHQAARPCCLGAVAHPEQVCCSSRSGTPSAGVHCAAFVHSCSASAVHADQA